MKILRILLAMICLFLASCDLGLPDYGIEYRIDSAQQVGDKVEITYTVSNTGHKDIENVELEITVINDSGEYFVGLTSKNDIDHEDTETKSISITIKGTYTQSYIFGTSIPQNIYISGAWWDKS